MPEGVRARHVHRGGHHDDANGGGIHKRGGLRAQRSVPIPRHGEGLRQGIVRLHQTRAEGPGLWTELQEVGRHDVQRGQAAKTAHVCKRVLQ